MILNRKFANPAKVTKLDSVPYCTSLAYEYKTHFKAWIFDNRSGSGARPLFGIFFQPGNGEKR